MSVKWDGTLRYIVTSRTRPGVKHVCELEHYAFNGICSCEHFTMNLEKYLKRGMTAEDVAEKKLVKLKNKERPQDALRCSHLVDAWMEWAIDSAKTVIEHEAKHSSEAQH